MTAVSSQSIAGPGNTTQPSPITPTSSDTIAEAQFGANGCVMRIITTGTVTNVTVLDPGKSPSGNNGTAIVNGVPATGARMLYIPRAAIDPATQVATVTFSGALTGVTYELYRY